MTGQEPLLTIITVVRNAEAVIRSTLESITGQTCHDFEYIVIDGRSSDRTLSILSAYHGRITSFVSERDDGIYDAMNKGIRRASGRYLNFMNAGDRFYDERALEKIIPLLASGHQDIVIGDTVIEYQGGFRRVRAARPARYEMPSYHQSVFFHRRVFERHGEYDTAFRFAADLDLWLKIRQAPESRVLIYHEPVSINNLEGFSNRDHFAVLKEMRQVYRKNFSGRMLCAGYINSFADAARFFLIRVFKRMNIYRWLIRIRYRGRGTGIKS